MTIKKEEKIRILREYSEANELKKTALKRYDELKAQILSDIEAGKYGNFVLDFEERDVKEYTVKARTDKIVKVMKVGAK